MNEQRIDKLDNRWACACIKRDRAGKLKAIKLHPDSAQYCHACGAKRPNRKGAV